MECSRTMECSTGAEGKSLNKERARGLLSDLLRLVDLASLRKLFLKTFELSRTSQDPGAQASKLASKLAGRKADTTPGALVPDSSGLLYMSREWSSIKPVSQLTRGEQVGILCRKALPVRALRDYLSSVGQYCSQQREETSAPQRELAHRVVRHWVQVLPRREAGRYAVFNRCARHPLSSTPIRARPRAK